MRHSRCENQEVPGSKVVISSFRLDQKAPLEDLDRHVSSCRMPVQSTTGLEGKKDVRDGRTVEDGDLPVSVLRRMVLSPQTGQPLGQVEGVSGSGKAIDRSPPKPLAPLVVIR